MKKKNIINVGIIDDDKTKRTQIIECIKGGLEGEDESVQEIYADYELNPIELKIELDVCNIIDQIIDKNIDALLVDYKLSSFEQVSYTGVNIAELANKKYLNYPVFILTSFETELYRHEIFDVTKVFDINTYMSKESEVAELNRKIIEQCLMRKKNIEKKKKEFDELLLREGESQEINDRILELDTFIERSLDGEAALSEEDKKRLLNQETDELLELLNQIIKKEQENG